ncbi:MAG: vitamin K epoxide reductase family protein [Acidobacteria bacterium]|nr:vitamin K epoxide reductase family protein [Acidobacteriota bacterium]
MSKSWLLMLISLLAVAGLILSSLSLVNHYKKSATEYCDLGENFNCDLVNRSPWSEVAHVPVAAIGMAGYVFLFVMSRIAASRPQAALLMLIAATAGLAFALYLTYIEAYKLDAWCILCLGSLAAISLIAILSAARVVTARRRAAA